MFLAGTPWRDAVVEPLSGDASARIYWRLRRGSETAVLMDASRIPDCLSPYITLSAHLKNMGLSAPEVFFADLHGGCAIIEDFGDATFAHLLEQGCDASELYALGTDLLIALHGNHAAAPANWREYHPQQMLADIHLYLEWVAANVDEEGKSEFRERWLRVLPLAFQVPQNLLLRDYHVANLMWLPERRGVQRAGLIDFQDAYRGPISYDLMSLLEDARRDIASEFRQQMLQRYFKAFPTLDQAAFAVSYSILAAQRHTRVLAVFARLAKRDGKPEYQQQHSARVRRLLMNALQHPVLNEVKEWFETYAPRD